MGSFCPMGRGGTINMFVSITEITEGSRGGFTRGSVLQCYTGKHTHTQTYTDTHTHTLAPLKKNSIPPLPRAPALFPFLLPSTSSTLHPPFPSLASPNPPRWIKYNRTCDHFSFCEGSNTSGPKGRRARGTPQLWNAVFAGSVNALKHT